MRELTLNGNRIVRLTLNLFTCTPTTAHIVNHWLTGVLIEGSSMRVLLSSISLHTFMSTFEELITMRLLQFPFLPLMLWIIHRLAQLSSSCTSMHIVERGRPFIHMCSLSGIRMIRKKNKGR